MINQANEKEGKSQFNEIMMAGNFGDKMNE